MAPAEATAPADRLRLGSADLAVLARIVALWPAAAVLKRVLPLPRLARFFDAAPGNRSIDPARAARLIDGILRRAYRHRPGFCVERSLILFRLLRRAGQPVRLCFGVRRHGGGITGHAWVARLGDDTPIAERGDPRAHYATTYVYPAREAG